MLFGFLAALTTLELVTGIIILPQRQTALVAKQAAEVDLLTGGRFRLGVGLGWNAVEYEALGKDFANRGRRIERAGRAAAPAVDRADASPTEAGDEQVTGAGPGPAAGAAADPDLVRWPVAARPTGASGGSPTAGSRRCAPGPKLDEARAIVEEAAREAGRDPAAIGMEGRVSLRRRAASPSWSSRPAAGETAGATHLSINTMGAGLGAVDGHLAVLTDVAKALGLAQ